MECNGPVLHSHNRLGRSKEKLLKNIEHLLPEKLKYFKETADKPLMNYERLLTICIDTYYDIEGSVYSMYSDYNCFGEMFSFTSDNDRQAQDDCSKRDYQNAFDSIEQPAQAAGAEQNRDLTHGSAIYTPGDRRRITYIEPSTRYVDPETNIAKKVQVIGPDSIFEYVNSMGPEPDKPTAIAPYDAYDYINSGRSDSLRTHPKTDAGQSRPSPKPIPSN